MNSSPDKETFFDAAQGALSKQSTPRLLEKDQFSRNTNSRP
jgi:hypothetical protein